MEIQRDIDIRYKGNVKRNKQEGEENVARSKFQTLTEQMFYILLCFQEECFGTEVMKSVREMTDGRVNVGPGTLYNLLEQFTNAGMIEQTRTEGRRRCYRLTETGREALREEYERLKYQIHDYELYIKS